MSLAKNNQEFRAVILDELEKFAVELKARSEVNGAGIYWESLAISARGAHRKLNDSIFTGTTGVILFFISLYKVTNNADHLQTALDGSAWLEMHIENTPTKGIAAFYSGRTGVAFMFIKLYEVTQDSIYLEKAHRVIQSLQAKLRRPNNFSDFLSGIAGNAFVISYLYLYLREESIVELLQICLSNLVDKVMPAHQGLKWTYPINDLDSLCGFSHGASGIAFVLLELGRCFDNTAFFWLAQQAMRYEALYYDPEHTNWLDLRVPSFEMAETAYQSRNDLFFHKVIDHDSNFWSHGAVGVGLVRLLANELIPSVQYRKELNRALSKTIETDFAQNRPIGYTLSQGKAGNAELFLEAYCQTGYEPYLQYVYTVANDLIAFKQRKGYFPRGLDPSQDDNSLFLGMTGSAYFLLRVLEPQQVDSLLLPRIKAPVLPKPLLPKQGTLSVTKASLKRRIYGHYFGRSLACFDSIDPTIVETILSASDVLSNPDEAVDEFERVIGLLQEAVHSVSSHYQPLLGDIIALEKTSLQLLTNSESYVQTIIRNKLSTEAYLAMADQIDQLGSCQVKLNPMVTLIHMQWDWSKAECIDDINKLLLSPGAYSVLLIRKAYSVEEFLVNPISKAIFEVLPLTAEVATLVEQSVNDLCSRYGATDEATLTQLVVEQVKAFLSANILLIK